MKIIGITGGVGSGKSRVLSYMEEKFHATVCQADHVAWELQKPESPCYAQIVAKFGKTVLREDGAINRATLGKIVFESKERLDELNSIMHPAVKEEILARIDKEQRRGTNLFVLEAALLLEANYAHICDEVWYIYADEMIRCQRLIKDRGYTDEKISAVMSAQLSDVSFREQCQVVIDNGGDFKDTCYQIDKALGEII